jgi:glyoxylase-like metal-dependent hydrolase (beta-lactamase superfamily II)
MIDAPRWTREVYGPIEELGGLPDIMLSHRYAENFGARVRIHEDDLDAAPYATNLIAGEDPVTIRDDVVAFPVAGHTKGSVLYLFDGHLLFSGDSLASKPEGNGVLAFRDACWYSWRAQQESLTRFASSDCRFIRLFCAHG